jgi:hypothetical protein
MSKLTEADPFLTEQTRLWLNTLSPQDLASVLNVAYLSTCKPETKPEAGALRETKASQQIGQAAELDFYTIIKSLDQRFSSTYTASAGHQGDFIIEFRDGDQYFRILVDVKKYRASVPRKEIEKFYSDLTYGNFDAGVLYSASSKIVGVTQSVHLETKDLPYGQVPVMFLSDISSDFILKSLELLALRLLVQKEKTRSLDQVHSLVVYINVAISQSAAVRRILNELQRGVSDHVNRCQELLIGLEVQFKQAMISIDPEHKQAFDTEQTPEQYDETRIPDDAKELLELLKPFCVHINDEKKDYTLHFENKRAHLTVTIKSKKVSVKYPASGRSFKLTREIVDKFLNVQV